MNRKHIITLTAGAGILAGSLGLFTGVALSPTDTEIRTVETEVEVTPDTCAEALDHAENIMSTLAGMLEIGQEALEAAVDFDLAGLEAASEEMGAGADLIEPLIDAYAAAATACDGEPRGDNGGLSA